MRQRVHETESDDPSDLCLHQLFERHALGGAARTALVWAEGSLRYDELECQANQLARYLCARGVGPEVLVGVCIPRSADLVVAILGILKAGGAFLPLDPAYPEERLAFMLGDSRAALVLTREAELSRLPALESVMCLDREWAAIARESSGELQPSARPENLAYVIYTSGSTGRPKGIALAHRGVVSNISDLNRRFAVGPADVLLSVSSLSFDMSVYEILGTLGAGATLVLPDPAQVRDPGDLAQAIARHQVTVWNSAPALLDALVTHERARDTGRLRSLRLALSGGDWAPLKLPERLRALAPSIRFINLGGATEASIHSTLFEVEHTHPEWSSIPYGQAMEHQFLYVLDAEGQEVGPGVAGELHIGGVGLARGYWRRPGLTAERFVPNPFRPGERMYRTGDIVRRLPDGNLELLGRSDHQTKIRGVRVELGEVEAALERHPAVERAVAMVREDVPGERSLVAYVVTDREAPDLARELRCFVAERLPEPFVPAHVLRLAALPLTPNGKLDRGSLPPPGLRRRGVDDDYAPPRTEVETELARFAAELLSLDEVGVHDDWFAFGAHSLFLARLASRVRARFGVEVALCEMLQVPSVAHLAELVTRRQAESTRVLEPIPRASRERDLRASFAQERLWFIEQLCKDGPRPYNEVVTLRLTGTLDAELLQRSLGDLAARHEALRTRFRMQSGELCQIVDPPGPVPLPVLDLSLASSTEQAARLRAWCIEAGQRPFDLENGPLFRAELFRCARTEHVLVLALHHLITDGWSNGVWVRDLAALYEALKRGVAAKLEALPLQYADYAAWERQELRGSELAARVEAFLRRVRGAPTVLELPCDRRRPAAPGFRGARAPVVVPPELTRALGELARREDVTLFTALLSLFELLLSRYAGQNDFLLGTVAANRRRPELEHLVGFFANTLVVRADLSGVPTFRELCARTRRAWLDVMESEDTPLDALVDALRPGKQLDRNPLFQTLFVLHDTPRAPARFADLRAELELADNGSSKFDLSLSLETRAGELVGHFEYDVDLFEGATIERMTAHFLQLAKSAVEDPDRAVSRLRLWTDEDLSRLAQWNDTERSGRDARGVHEIFHAVAAREPNAVALRHGNRQMTYRELDERSSRLAHHLRGLGVGPEVRVAVCLERSFDLVVSLLGVLKAGGAYVPLEPGAPPGRLAFSFEDSAASVLVTLGWLEASLPPFAGQRVRLDLDAPRVGAASAALPAGPRPTPDNLAYLIYTSGSTGRPKAVMIEHRGLTNYLTWCIEAYRVADGTGAPVQSSPAVDLTVTSLFGPLLAGRTVVILPEDPSTFAHAVRSDAAYSLLKLTPTQLGLLNESLTPVEAAGIAKTLVFGGEALQAEALAFFRSHAPRTRLINEYGPTETVVGCAVHEVLADEAAHGVVPIGRPIANTRLYVLDGSVELAPVGVIGELHVGGDGVGRGYFRRPALTAERFIPDPFGARPGARLYKTGDLARYRPDGTVEYLGRSDYQVKVRGFRVELGEIEASLARVGAVREAVVVQEPDGARRLLAYVAATPDCSGTTLAQALKEELPSSMIPDVFVFLERLPRSATGKLDRSALPRVEPMPASGGAVTVSPRGPVEQLLAASWADLLGVPALGVFDDFFETGGNSLLAIRAIARLRDYFHVEFSLRDFLAAPTVAGAAQALSADPLERGRVEETARLILGLAELDEDEARRRLREL